MLFTLKWIPYKVQSHFNLNSLKWEGGDVSFQDTGWCSSTESHNNSFETIIMNPESTISKDILKVTLSCVINYNL